MVEEDIEREADSESKKFILKPNIMKIQLWKT